MSFDVVVLDAGQGRPIWQLGNQFSVKATGKETDGAYSLLEQICGGAPPPRHVHDDEEEAFYVIEGMLDVHVGDDVRSAGPGSFCLIPRGTEHTFVSTGPEPARILVLVSPSGFEEFLVECERRFPQSAGMPQPERAVPVLSELAKDHGLRIVGPPPS